jgi:hypothetical protein
VSLVPSFTDLLQPLSCVMTCPTFESFLTVLTGWVFARRRTVTGMILAADAVAGEGDGGAKHHSAYHRLFAAARWSLDELGLAVFAVVLPLIDGVVLLAMDDTLARKRGLKVFGVGMHHDPLLSTRKTAITNWAHCWVVLGVVLKMPFCGERYFCLPVLFRLYVPKKTAQNKGLAYRTKPQLVVQMLQLLCSRYAQRRFHAIGDSAYGGKSVLLLNLPANCDLTSRLKMDARLYDAPVNVKRRKGTKGGRPRKRGQRRPTPEQMLQGRCRHLTLDVYGRRDSKQPRCRVHRPLLCGPGPAAEGGGGRAADRRPQAAGVLLDVPAGRGGNGADAIRLSLADRGDQPRRQGPARVRGAAGMDEARGGAHRADGDAAVLAGGALVRTRRAPALRAPATPLVSRESGRTGWRIVRRHAHDAPLPERQARGFVDAPAWPGKQKRCENPDSRGESGRISAKVELSHGVIQFAPSDAPTIRV